MHPASHAYKLSDRPSRADAGIDWEQLPSLAHLITRPKPHREEDDPAWRQTMPAEFDVLAPSGPFVEALPGVLLREVNEPDVLKVLFGVDC